MQQRKTAYVTVSLTESARDELQSATLELTSPAGRRLSMSAVLEVALRVARNHPEETLEALRQAP